MSELLGRLQDLRKMSGGSSDLLCHEGEEGAADDADAAAAAGSQSSEEVAATQPEPPASQEESDEDDEAADSVGELAGKRKRGSTSPTYARRAHVANFDGRVSRTISIDRLPEEGKRILYASRLSRQMSEDSLDRRVVARLLQPRGWRPPAERAFPFTPAEVEQLCAKAQAIVEGQPPLIRLSAPVKIFGDLHGQYGDLMRLFEQFGQPSREGGDIDLVDYLFLGDYVDRGKHSLETVVLLLALKCLHPDRVFLIRGNHESPEVNARDGFLHECVERFGDRKKGVAVWRRLNQLFEWLPLAALVNDVILCVHGGIGEHLASIDEVDALQRPLRMGGPDGDLLLDLLWSDPTESDEVKGLHENVERGAPVVCFGPDRVSSFLRANSLKLIVRAHECVMDGFQRFAGGKLVTVFSATNYCNRWANAGALLLVGKDLNLVPKMIFPVDDLEDAWLRNDDDDGEEDDDLKDMRPPTPPRDAGREGRRASSPGAVEQLRAAAKHARSEGGAPSAAADDDEDGGGPMPPPPLPMRPPTPPRLEPPREGVVKPTAERASDLFERAKKSE